MKKGYIPKTSAPSGKPAFPKKVGFPPRSTVIPFDSHKANHYFVIFFFLLAFLLYGNTSLNKYAVDDDYVANNLQIQQGFKVIPGVF